MNKDFDNWNKRKKVIDCQQKFFYCNEQELWWCALGMNVGFEQNGVGKEYLRPVLVLKGLSKQTCFVIPLTTSSSSHKFRPHIGLVDNKNAHAILSQLRAIDIKRLVRKIGVLDKDIFDRVRKTVKNMF